MNIKTQESGWSKGCFALGLLLGFLATVLASITFGRCDDGESILWFCDEEPEVVLATLEFLQGALSFLAWPAALLVLGVVFKPVLIEALPRLHKFGPEGVVMYPQSGEQRAIDGGTKADLKLQRLDPLNDPVAVDLENGIREDLAKIAKEEREERLVRALTESQMLGSFALVYANIFGSQIDALEKLNSRSIPRQDAEKEFALLRQDQPEFKDWTLEGYLNFLFVSKLIAEENGIYQITPTGKNFLLFLTRAQLSKDRPL